MKLQIRTTIGYGVKLVRLGYDGLGKKFELLLQNIFYRA